MDPSPSRTACMATNRWSKRWPPSMIWWSTPMKVEPRFPLAGTRRSRDHTMAHDIGRLFDRKLGQQRRRRDHRQLFVEQKFRRMDTCREMRRIASRDDDVGGRQIRRLTGLSGRRPNRDVWILVLKFQKPRQQPVHRQGRRRLDRHDQPVFLPADIFAGALDFVDRLTQLFGQHLTIGREDKTSALAHEHLLSQPVFEGIDLLADRPMGHAQFGGGRGEAGSARGNRKCPQRHQR